MHSALKRRLDQALGFSAPTGSHFSLYKPILALTFYHFDAEMALFLFVELFHLEFSGKNKLILFSKEMKCCIPVRKLLLTNGGGSNII